MVIRMRKLAFIVFMMSSLLWAGRASIAFHSTSEVAIGRIHLGDIANIEGDSNLVQALKTLEVGRLELPGRETHLTVNAIRNFYLRSICSLDSLDVIGSGSVTVRSRSNKIDRDSLTTLLLAFIGPKINGVKGVDWDINTDKLPKEIQVPEGVFTFNFEVPARFNGRGDESATLKIDLDGKTNMRYTLPFMIRRWGNVVHTVTAIQRGQVVQTSMIKLDRVELTHQPRPMVSRLDDALGRTALRTIARDQDLSDTWLERPYAVREGDQIRLNVVLGSAQVSTMGVAKQNGYEGQRILVENLETHKRMQAEVSAHGEVRVVN